MIQIVDYLLNIRYEVRDLFSYALYLLRQFDGSPNLENNSKNNLETNSENNSEDNLENNSENNSESLFPDHAPLDSEAKKHLSKNFDKFVRSDEFIYLLKHDFEFGVCFFLYFVL